MNRFGVGLSTRRDPHDAALEACAGALDGLAGREPDLVCVFASQAHADAAEGLATTVVDELQPAAVIGAVGPDGVIGAAREIERGPAVSVFAAALPGAGVEPFRLRFAEVDGRPAVVGDPGLSDAAEDSPVILLADPYTFPADAFLAHLNATSAGRSVIGGLAGGGRPGAAILFDGADVVHDGAVGVTVTGAGVVPLVSQGCRPVGPDLVVTASRDNVVLELAGTPALQKLHDIVAGLPPDEQRLVATGILAGLVVDENQPDYEVGDYLVRALLGADTASGGLAVGDTPRVGQTFRFHVRDEASADADLDATLAAGRRRLGRRTPGAALLFACNGRGSNLFSTPDHDATRVAVDLGVPSAGIFCQGEFGPVGGANHLHGFTATVAVFPH
jgi:small ligand-binding sensory domain FIST